MAITASEARRNLFPLIDQVNDDQEPVEIVSRRGSAFLVSESQYRSLMETAYLLRSPANAGRLLESIAALEQGKGTTRELLDVDREHAVPVDADPPQQPADRATKSTSPATAKAVKPSQR